MTTDPYRSFAASREISTAHATSACDPMWAAYVKLAEAAYHAEEAAAIARRIYEEAAELAANAVAARDGARQAAYRARALAGDVEAAKTIADEYTAAP